MKKTNTNSPRQSSNAIASLFSNAIIKAKAEVAQAVAEQKIKSQAQAKLTIANIRAEYEQKLAKVNLDAELAIANEKTKTNKTTEQIIKLKIKAGGKKKTLALQIAQHKVELIEKEKAHSKQIGGIRTETEKSIAGINAEHDRQINNVRAQAYREMVKQKTIAGANAAKVIFQIKAQAKEKDESHDEEITIVRAETEERVKALTEQITKLKAELTEKEKTHSEQISDIKTKTKKSITNINAKFTQQLNKVKAQAYKEIIIQKTIAGANAAKVISQIKSETEKTIANEKSRADEAAEKFEKLEQKFQEAMANNEAKTQARQQRHSEQIAELKTKIEERLKTLTSQIERLKADAEKSISENTQTMAQSQTNLQGEQSLTVLELYAEDVMQKELLWASPEDTVQQTLTKTKQQYANYIMVGLNQVLEGIVSKFDLDAAINSHLQPVSAKWYRPFGGTTVQIKFNQIMSKPVHIIEPYTPLTVVMDNMCRFCVHVLPVADQQGKVLGLVTEADIFKAIIKQKTKSCTFASGQTPETQSAPAAIVKYNINRPTGIRKPPVVSV